MHKDCKECKEWEEHFYCKHLNVKFYRIMSGDFSRRMSLPEEFMNKFKGQISQNVHLKSPSGNIWHVNTTKIQGDIFLESGWKDFVKSHHIEKNDLLLFDYDETKSCFRVSIFGSNGYEKASPYLAKFSNDSHHSGFEESSSTRDSYHKTLEAPSGSKPRRPSKAHHKVANRLQRGRLRHSKRRTRHEDLSVHQEKLDGKQRCREYNMKQEPFESHEHDEQTDYAKYMSTKKRLTEAETKKVLLMVPGIQAGNPYFVSVMLPSYLHPGFLLVVPQSFAVPHLPSKSQSLVLTTPGWRKKWLVSYLVLKAVSCIKRNWKTFAIDNQLEVGDVCLFELMKSKRILTMKVHISRK